MGQKQSLTSREIEEAFEEAGRGGSLSRDGAATLLKRIGRRHGVQVKKSELRPTLNDVNSLDDVRRCAAMHWERALLSGSMNAMLGDCDEDDDDDDDEDDNQGKGPKPFQYGQGQVVFFGAEEERFDGSSPLASFVTFCGCADDGAALRAFFDFAEQFGAMNVGTLREPYRRLQLATALVCKRNGLGRHLTRYVVELAENSFPMMMAGLVAHFKCDDGLQIIRADTSPGQSSKRSLGLFGVSHLALDFRPRAQLMSEPPKNTHGLLFYVEPDVLVLENAVQPYAEVHQALLSVHQYLEIHLVLPPYMMDRPDYSKLYSMFPRGASFNTSIHIGLGRMFQEPLMEGRPLRWADERAYVYPLSERQSDSSFNNENEHPKPSPLVPAWEEDDDNRSNKHLAHRFTKMAQAEYASIGSFSLFSMQLVSCGAPLALIRDAHSAALDEIEHARLAFQLANRFSSAQKTRSRKKRVSVVGPSSSASDHHAIVEPSVYTLAMSTARDACINETASCWRAIDDLEVETDEAVRRALRVVVSDETRHAALGWRTVRWCLKEQRRQQSDGSDDQLGVSLRTMFSKSVYRRRLLPLLRWLFGEEGQDDALEDVLSQVLYQ